MKKIALLASVAVLSTAAMADASCSVTGFYAGANAGLASAEGKANNSAAAVQVKNVKLSGRSIQYGAFAGYNMGLGNGVVVGGEVFLGGDNAKVAYNTVDAKRELKRTMNYGIAPRVGYMITSNVLAFIRLGVEGGSWKLSTTGEKTIKKNKVSFAPGVGFDVFASKNVFVRAQYHHAFGPKVKANAFEVKASQSVFALGFGYKF